MATAPGRNAAGFAAAREGAAPLRMRRKRDDGAARPAVPALLERRIATQPFQKNTSPISLPNACAIRNASSSDGA